MKAEIVTIDTGDSIFILGDYIEKNYNVTEYTFPPDIHEILSKEKYPYSPILVLVISCPFPKPLYAAIKKRFSKAHVAWIRQDKNETTPHKEVEVFELIEKKDTDRRLALVAEAFNKKNQWDLFTEILEKYLSKYKK